MEKAAGVGRERGWRGGLLLLGQGSKLSLGGGRDCAGMLEDWDHGGQEVSEGRK